VAAAAAAGWSLLESRHDVGGAGAGGPAGATRPAWLPTLMLTTAAGSAALAVGLSGSIVLGQLTGALAAALGGALVATRLRLAPPLLPGAAPVLALPLLGLLLAATVHASLPPLSAALLALAAVVPPPSAGAGDKASAPDCGASCSGSSSSRPSGAPRSAWPSRPRRRSWARRAGSQSRRALAHVDDRAGLDRLEAQLARPGQQLGAVGARVHEELAVLDGDEVGQHRQADLGGR
jgi:hypothetical protein